MSTTTLPLRLPRRLSALAAALLPLAFAGAAAGLLFLAQVLMTSAGDKAAGRAAQAVMAQMGGGGAR